MPTLTVRTVVQPSVYMYLEGLPGLLTAKEISQWIEVTENHIWRYFDEVNDSVPGGKAPDIPTVISRPFPDYSHRILILLSASISLDNSTSC